MIIPEPIDVWSGCIPGALADEQEEIVTGEENGLCISNVHTPGLYPFLVAGASAAPAVVICPGGAYGGLAIHKEGFAIARWLNRLGMQAFVLKYRLAPHRHPVPLMDAQQAMRLVRDRCETFGVNPDCVGIMGFSAGGHLAATVATHYPRPVRTEGPLATVSCRPDFVILGYPVISFTDPVNTHTGTRQNLLGEAEANSTLVRELSAELSVPPDAPPAFLFHAEDDSGVPIGNSESYCAAMAARGRSAELYRVKQGGHGFGSLIDDWQQPCQDWLAERCAFSPPPPNA